MNVIGLVLKNSLDLTSKFLLKDVPVEKAQRRVFRQLLRKAADTHFGRKYGFDRILAAPDPVRAYAEAVPFFTYESILPWWQMAMQGHPSVTWPGRVEYFAVSSGTTKGTTKYIPVTKAMLRAIQRTSAEQLLSLSNFQLSPGFFQRQILMLGSSTDLQHNGIAAVGDLSGIISRRMPAWFRPFARPTPEILRTRDWAEKLDKIARSAPEWDIGAIVGVPSWFILLFEKIRDRYGIRTIHDIWPHLELFVHGGVSFAPYRQTFESFLAKPLTYVETYLASEGFIAYQRRPDVNAMYLNLRNGIFFEFIPFDADHFDERGEPRPEAKAVPAWEVEIGRNYAIILSTCAGAWRYLIGDTVQFVTPTELVITGRTSHYLSYVGEHVSVGNIDMAVERAARELECPIQEYTVTGRKDGSLFYHHWYVGVEEGVECSAEALARRLDEAMKAINEDYASVRKYTLRAPRVTLVPPQLFVEWLKRYTKFSAQSKFPRTLRGQRLQQWENLLKEHGIDIA